MSNPTQETEQPYTQDEVDAAESAEQASLSASQNAYLTRRVVVLRAQLNRAHEQINQLQQAIVMFQAQLPQDGEPAEEQGEDVEDYAAQGDESQVNTE